MTWFLCGPFQGCCLATTTIEGTVVFYAVCSGNNGKLFILYTTMVNSVAMQQQSKCFLCGPIQGFITWLIRYYLVVNY
jgi:hypothetical protein